MILKGIKGIVYSNIWVAINVVAYYVFVVKLLNLNYDYRYSMLLFLSTVFAYNYQRLLKNESSSKSSHHSERHGWIGEHQRLVKILTYISAVGTVLISLWILPIHLLVMSLPALVIVMFYARRSNGLTALRNIPFLKIFLISVVWVFVVLIVPLLMEEISLTVDVLLLSLMLFVYVAIMCIPFDIRDRKVDLDKLKTVPVVLGVKASKILAIVMMLGLAISGWLLEIYAFGLVSTTVIPSLIYTEEHRKELFFTGWIEGQFVLLMLLQLTIDVI